MAQPSYDDINGLYNQYLGRGASQDEYANWISGNYGSTDLGGITSQIQTSGEAQDYSKRTSSGGGNPPPATGGSDSTAAPAPAPTPAPQPPPQNTGQPSYDDINAAYTQYLGRGASQDEYQNWLSGAYGHTDLPGIQQQISTSGEAQNYYAANGLPNPLSTFTGFDPSRKDSNTLKYNAMNVLQSFNPNDPNAIQQAFNILNQQAPGQYQLDAQGNLMLTGTADGYIGARPVGWGSGGSWYNPDQGQYDWQWMGYNAAHPGPNGEGLGPANAVTGGPGGAGGAGGSALSSQLQALLGRFGAGGGSGLGGSLAGLGSLGSAYGGPGTSGIYSSNYLQQVGQDPFSQAITGALTQLLGTAAGRMNSTPQDYAAALEQARMPYEMARKVQLGNARDQLAARGLLSTDSPGGGLEADASQRIETALAPAYTGAVDNAVQELNKNEQGWANILGGAAQQGTQRQQVLGSLALQELAQNQSFTQFMAQYGINRDLALYQIQQGQGQQLLQAFQLYLNYAHLANEGYA